MIEAVKELLKSPVAYHPILAKLTGSPSAAVMLSQGMYWQGKAEDKGEEWFWVTADGWFQQCGLTQNVQETARKVLRATDFWFEKKAGVPAKLYYRIDAVALVSGITAYLNGGKPDYRNTGNKVAALREPGTGRYGKQVSGVSDDKDNSIILEENNKESNQSVGQGSTDQGKTKADVEGAVKPQKQPADKAAAGAAKQLAIIHSMVQIFETEHKRHFSPKGVWMGFSWGEAGNNGKRGGKQFAGLRGLKEKLQKSFKAMREKEPTDEELLASFTLFMQKAVEADRFVLDNWFTPCNMNANYQTIVQKIHTKNGTGKRSTNGTSANGTNTGSNGSTDSPFFKGFDR